MLAVAQSSEDFINGLWNLQIKDACIAGGSGFASGISACWGGHAGWYFGKKARGNANYVRSCGNTTAAIARIRTKSIDEDLVARSSVQLENTNNST